ncbi:MAG: 2,3-bisphosphoglycerate-independent phosphoglycerate mutase [Nanoarchaeota archaeon]|nr:2,3-bisphosphoglycerate-independent phosphoglycerate mutase [Nanoarchaeota archaeon]
MRPTVLIIMDGFGLRKEVKGNAIRAATKPNLDRLFKEYPFTTLDASGIAVGLPKGIMGNSEVGHLNIGSGRTVHQELVRINEAIKDGSFFWNPTLLDAISHVKKYNSSLHLMGLLSDGQVHSSIDHLFALMKLAVDNELKKDIFLHAFLDGRDTPPRSAEKYIKMVYKKRKQLGLHMTITTIMGRYYSMDRDNRWQRDELAYRAMVDRKGYNFPSSLAGLEAAYRRGESDEFVKPTVTDRGHIKDNDAIIFFNFRSDRAREITRTFKELKFQKFRRRRIKNLNFTTFTKYDKRIKVPVAFPDQDIPNTLAEWLSKKGHKQFHTAETEKYPHVTFFFNGGRETPWKGESRRVVPSPKVATYDLQPEMSAEKITQSLLKEINKNRYSFILVNFANCDMVGHTGIWEAVIKAVETVDKNVGLVVDKVLEKHGNVLIIADHGNAEEVTGVHQTSHTTNPVPCCLISNKIDLRHAKLKKGKLGDVAPTILKIMKIAQPDEMSGKALF